MRRNVEWRRKNGFDNFLKEKESAVIPLYPQIWPAEAFHSEFEQRVPINQSLHTLLVTVKGK